ncbi:16311_t:CDS:1, partial [Gigaspora rosea]
KFKIGKEYKEILEKLYEKDIWTKFEKEIIFIKYNEPPISAEKIRKMIMDNDEKWKELYSSEMIEYIKENKI